MCCTKLKLWLLLLVGFSSLTCITARDAYITLVYGDTYGLAARVMFQSLKETGTTKDMAAMVTPDVNIGTRTKLQNLGVMVIDIPVVTNAYAGEVQYQERFVGVLSKLLIWNMTQYDTLVFLDADTLVFQNVDELFRCGDFCAAFINPMTFNSGVMVLKPNAQVMADMMDKLASGMDSYDGGDQGFLNSYFPDLINAPMFTGDSSAHPNAPMKRLASRYHTDHALYYSHLSWGIFEPAVIEFVGVPGLKPWLWWSYIAMDVSWLWLSFRDKLPANASDDQEDIMRVRLLFALPVLLLGGVVALIWYLRKFSSSMHPLFHNCNVSIHALLTVVDALILTPLATAAYIPFQIIPPTAHPTLAWSLFFVWFYFVLIMGFGVLCSLCFTIGYYHNSAVGYQSEQLPRQHQPPFLVSLFGLLVIMFSAGRFYQSSTQTDFSDLAPKLSSLVFGVIGILLLHLLVMSRMCAMWFTYGINKGQAPFQVLKEMLRVSYAGRLKRHTNLVLLAIVCLAFLLLTVTNPPGFVLL